MFMSCLLGLGKIDKYNKTNHQLCKSAGSGKALTTLRASGLFNAIVSSRLC